MTEGGADPVVVVGGGIVGASVAYHLSRRDVAVQLFERAGTLGAETTARSSLGLRQYGTDEVQLRMKRYGKRLYNEFLAESPTSLRYEPIEVLHVATTDAGRDEIERTRAAEHPLGSPSEVVPGTELRDVLVVPEVREDRVEVALYRPNSGYFASTPSSLVRAFADRAADDGATILPNTRVTDVLLDDGGVEGVVANGDRRPARAVVAAAGPWNDEVAAMVGVDLPVRQQLLSVLELDPDRPSGRTLPKIRHVESGVTVRGRPDGRVLAYHAEPAADPYAAGAAYDPDGARDVPESARRAILESVRTLLPALADADVVDEDVAYTSRTPDGNPIVGRTGTPGFLVAALHSRGVQYAPAVGQVVARQVADDDPTEFHPAVSIARFEGHTDRYAG